MGVYMYGSTYFITTECAQSAKIVECVLCMTILFLCLQITRSDIRPHVKRAFSLVNVEYHLIFFRPLIQPPRHFKIICLKIALSSESMLSVSETCCRNTEQKIPPPAVATSMIASHL